MCQKASIRTDRKGERTRIRASRTAQPQSHTPERRRVVKSQAELVRLLSRWCVYFRALQIEKTGDRHHAHAVGRWIVRPFGNVVNTGNVPNTFWGMAFSPVEDNR